MNSDSDRTESNSDEPNHQLNYASEIHGKDEPCRPILRGVVVSLLTMCVLSFLARYFAPSLVDSYPPPPEELRNARLLFAVLLWVLSILMGFFSYLRAKKWNKELSDIERALNDS